MMITQRLWRFGKYYAAVPDEKAMARHFVRIIDESGEDYLYPEGYFVRIDLPQAAVRAIGRAS
jgi:hypothetical protein